MREIVSPLSGIRSPFGQPVDPYKVAGRRPPLVFDFDAERYRTGGAGSSFSSAITHAATTNATMVDSDGLIKWRPHNLLTYSEDFSNAAWTQFSASPSASESFLGLTVSTITSSSASGSIAQAAGSTGPSYTGRVFSKANSLTDVEVRLGKDGNYVTCVFDLSAGTAGTATAAGTATEASASISDMGDGVYLCSVTGANLGNGTDFNFAIIPGSISAGIGSVDVAGAHVYRSDLGGMVDNPDRGDSYVPTTSSAVYLPRRGHHVWNGSSWVNEGLLHESEARTQLLHTTDALVTQSHTVTAVPHTLHFTGTGTVTLSGASTAGPLVGTGTGEENRVSLTFTPSAASLTLTVTGTVTDAQLEVGSTPSSYIPNLAASGTVTRAAETLTVPAANMPWSSSAVSLQMEGRQTGDSSTMFRWYADANNYITQESGTNDYTFEQANGGTVDSVTGGSFTSGILQSFNFASRHGSTFINGAVDGTALTEDTTPTALPDLESTDLSLGYDYMGTLKLVRIWANDIGDVGISEASA